jgi:hypothetical protein
MTISLMARAWGITLGLLVTTLLVVAAVVRTGAPLPVVGLGLVVFGVIAFLSYRSGGRYEFEYEHARPFDSNESPVIQRAVLEVCEHTDRPLPRIVLMEMDAPGADVGYDDGNPVVAFVPSSPANRRASGRECVVRTRTRSSENGYPHGLNSRIYSPDTRFQRVLARLSRRTRPVGGRHRLAVVQRTDLHRRETYSSRPVRTGIGHRTARTRAESLRQSDGGSTAQTRTLPAS